MAFCRATGVSHSLGIAFLINGMHELTYARRLIQLGGSLPHKFCKQTDAMSQKKKSQCDALIYGGKSCAEVIAVFVQKMILVAFEFMAQGLNHLTHIFRGKICCAEN
jgi:hypothetical protein